MLILLLDDIKIINFLHGKFFSIVLIIFIGILLLVLKKRSFKKLINKDNLYPIKLNKNNKFSSNKNSFFLQSRRKKVLSIL